MTKSGDKQNAKNKGAAATIRYLREVSEQTEEEEKGEESTTTVIYGETQGSFKIFRCPFCSASPFVSQIKLRKHLRQHHEGQKTLILSCRKPAVSNSFGLDLATFITPRLLLPKDVDIEIRTVPDHLPKQQTSEPLNPPSDAVTSPGSGAVPGSSMEPVTKTSTIVTNPPVRQEPKEPDKEPSPPVSLLLPLSPVKERRARKRKSMADHSPLPMAAKKAAKVQLPKAPEVAEKQILMLTDEEREREDDEEELDDPEWSPDPLEESEELTGPELIEEAPRVGFCGICSRVLSSSQLEETEAITTAPQLTSIIASVIGSSPRGEHFCCDCLDIAEEIGETRAELKLMQAMLDSAVSKLRDLYQVGEQLLESDLTSGGLLAGQLALRLVEEVEPPNRYFKHLGFNVRKSYKGIVLSPGQAGKDDGSAPEEVGQDNRGVSLYITHQEWASSGLTISRGQVQVPGELVEGVGVGWDRPRVFLSRALCQDLGPEVFFCMDCEERYCLLGDLLLHARSHERRVIRRRSDPIPPELGVSLLSSSQPSADDLLAPEGPAEVGFARAEVCSESDGRLDLGQRLDKIDRDINFGDEESLRNRLEFKSFMHREQFRQHANDVPTLDEPFQCTECRKTFASAHDLWGHQTSVGNTSFSCNYRSCSQVFVKLTDFAVHYAAHGGVALRIPPSLAEKKVLHITCPICSTVVSGLYKLARHKMKHDAELKYKCPACPKQFVKANTLRSHINSVHRERQKAQKECSLCDAVVYSESALAVHLRSVHGVHQKQECTCVHCGEVFAQEEELLSHMKHAHQPRDRRPAQQETSTCGKCGEMFAKSSLLQLHQDLADKNGGVCPIKKISRKRAKKVACPECSLLLSEDTPLAEHLEADHPGQEPRFQCSECSLRLLSLEGARNHYRLSHKDRPHTCFVCKETYTRDFTLHQHIASSHQEVVGSPPITGGPAQCRFCELSFSSYMLMVSHSRYTHMVESIDITNTELEEVTMIGGHVVEFGSGGEQIVALHTMP